MATKKQKLLIKVPEKFNAAQRQAVATEVINLIKSRTESGLDASNKPFKPYSKSYVNDIDFKLAGKKKSEVNLIFTGEMMNEIVVINEGTGFITIGFDDDGIDKRARYNKEHGREFLGITEKEKSKIIKSVSNNTDDEIEEIIEVPTLTERILSRLRGN